MKTSIIEQRGAVSFPTFTGERVYMRPFLKAAGLPKHLARWQSTVDAMLEGIDTDGPIYLMIDQAEVKDGISHRRPGLHIDGYWNPAISVHGGYPRPGHGPAPATPSKDKHMPNPSRHASSAAGDWRTDEGGSWNTASFAEPEAIILASNIEAARGYTGTFSGFIGDMGDCSTIDVSGLRPMDFHAGRVYAGNVTSLHESLPVTHDCLRTVVRLNVPGWSPGVH